MYKGKQIYAHRASFEVHIGIIPVGFGVLHRCDNPPCCNPKHLFLGTAKDNVEDMMAKKRHKFGEDSPKAILKEQDVVSIRSLRGTGLTFAAIADMYGVSKATIRSVAIKMTWRHIP